DHGRWRGGAVGSFIEQGHSPALQHERSNLATASTAWTGSCTSATSRAATPTTEVSSGQIRRWNRRNGRPDRRLPLPRLRGADGPRQHGALHALYLSLSV